jgi:pyridoxal phosphate enzyme (YggS family)
MSESLAEGVKRRLRIERERIVQAAISAGRDPGEVRLVAVSKTHPSDLIRAAYDEGQRDFGENYVQELQKKAAELSDLPDLVWHMIGHLQSNKARQVAGLVGCVHTVSSVKLARELGKRVGQHAANLGSAGRPLPVLLEVNIGGEENKSGCAPEEAFAVLTAIDEEPALVAKGLMTVPPSTPDPEGALPYFQKLRALRDDLGGLSRLPELSMGMSHDAEQAILAGATLVRIGTAIFGARAAAPG